MSKFQYIKHKDINFELWDECINNSLNGSIFALSGYLNIITQEWDAIVYSSCDKYDVVVPLPIFRKFGLVYIKQPNFAYELGVFYRKEISLEDFLLIEKIIKSNFLLISSYVFNSHNSRFFKKSSTSFEVKEIINYQIQLEKDGKKIFENISKTRRKHIRKAEKSSLHIYQSQDISDLICLFKKNVEDKIYGGVNEREYEKLEKIFLLFRASGKSLIYYVKKEGVVCGSLIIYFRRTMIDLFSASNEVGKKYNAESFLINSIAKENYSKFDFLDLGNAGSTGIRFFKESFNPISVVCIQISYNRLPYAYKILKGIRKLLILKALKLKYSFQGKNNEGN